VVSWHYGYPNDERLSAHPLYGLGLEFYAFHVTPPGRHGERAWVATFHEGTLTIYAKSVHVVAPAVVGPPSAALDRSCGMGENKPLD